MTYEQETAAEIGKRDRLIETLTRQRDELLAALEYHQEQTRPIQRTIDLIASIKEETK